MEKQKLKQTEIGKIPQEWDVVRVRDIFKVETGTTPSTKEISYWKNGTIDWITPADMNDLTNQLELPESRRKITPKAVKETNLTLMPLNSIVMSTRAPVGYVGIVKKEVTFNQGCKGLIPKIQDKVDTSFYAYYLSFKREYLNNISSGSTFKELSKDAFTNLEVPNPPLPEQRAISHVLSTMDEAIQKVDEAIEKAERLKKGLMQQLLTKGIKHKEFKQTEIGRIPKEWGVVELGDSRLFELIMGQSPDSDTYNQEKKGMPFLQGNAEFGYMYPEPKIFCSEPLKVADKGDILLSVRAPVGEVNIADQKLCIGRGLGAIRAKKDIDSSFLFYSLLACKGKLNNCAGGSTFKAITKDTLQSFKIPLPSLPEQYSIAKILIAMDNKISIGRTKKQKLEKIKKGLMIELLTGKKRIRNIKNA